MWLLIINAWKGLKKRKIQLLAIILMIALATSIYTAMNGSLNRMEDSYYHYLKKHAVEDFSVLPVINYQTDLDETKISNLINHSEFNQDEKQVLKMYQSCLPNCSAGLLYQVEQTVKENKEVYLSIAKEKLDIASLKYSFGYEYEQTKQVKEQTSTHKIISFTKEKSINKPYLLKGSLPEKAGEITLFPEYAKAKGIEIGNQITISEKTFTVVGFAYAPNYVYPLISFDEIFIDLDKNNISYVVEEDFESVNGVSENSFIIKYHDGVDKEATTKQIEEDGEEIIADYFSSLREMRIEMIKGDFESNRIFADAFLYLILGIAVFIVVIITKKRVDDEKTQIGVLKSLGYSSFSIATGYLVYPIVGTLIGGLLGFGIGFWLSDILANVFLSVYLFEMNPFTWQFEYLIPCILIPMVVLGILSGIVSLFLLRKKPLYLLREGSNIKVNIISRVFTRMISFLPFYSRFKYSLATRSLGKLIVVSLTSFFTGTLIVLTLIGMNLFGSIIDQVFSNFTYKYAVYYNTIETSEDNENDTVLTVPLPLIRTEKQNGETITPNEPLQITLDGVDESRRYIEIGLEDGKKVPNLDENKDVIMISDRLRQSQNLTVGDKLVFDWQGKEITYTVMGVTKEFFAESGYVSRLGLIEALEIPQNSYNLKYSMDDKYQDTNLLPKEEVGKISNIFSIEELENNIKSRIGDQNTMIYVIVSFAAFMALVIVGVVANIVVEENKKTISLLKVLGYKNKNINSMVLNIYTPFVIVSYLISIPIMVAVLKQVVASLGPNIGFSIPIEFSPWMALIGLIALLIAYYIAIGLSRNILNKVPLSVALKRE